MAFKKELVEIFGVCKTYPELISGMKVAKAKGYSQDEINNCVSHYKTLIASQSASDFKIIPKVENKPRGNVSYSVLPVKIGSMRETTILFNGDSFEV